MNWSAAALKATIGAGGLIAATVWWDFRDSRIEAWWDVAFLAPFAVALGPFMLLLFIRPGEVSDRLVRRAQIAAALWYLGLVAAAVAVMASRGFRPEDALLGFFLALGLTPCAAILRARRIDGGSADAG